MSAPAASRGMGMNMVTTLMAFSVSAFFVLFVFTRLVCARIQLRAAAAEHAAAAAAQASDAVFPASHVERGLRGMEPAVVTAFPTVKFGNDFQRPPAQEESQCTVCLEEYEAKDVVRVLPFCGHAFHVACIDAWLKQQSTCPICRASMRATAKHRAAAAVAMPPAVYYAVAMARPSTSSSDGSNNTLQGEAVTTLAPAAADHVEIVVADEPAPEDHVEIVVADEPASSGAGAGASCPSRTPAPAAASGNPASSGTTSQGIFFLETEQRSQGNASEDCLMLTRTL